MTLVHRTAQATARDRAPGGHAHDVPLLAVLVGPTASGKSAVALALAERLPLELVSMDSAQVYRGLDIGSAKPGPEERRRVPHHLIDVADPAESYSAARFATDARHAIEAIRTRGRLSLVVGGTMLYERALTRGLHALPAADPEVRARLERDAAREGWPALHARLARADPATASRLAPTDRQRIQRALEVLQATGRPLSAWLAEPAAGPASPERIVRIALEPADRGALHARIAQRFDRMLHEGLLEEVERLRARGDLHAGLPSMRSVGYRQAWQFLAGELDRTQLREAGIAATRQLAKRQLTWLRGMAERVVIDSEQPDVAARVYEVLARALG